jgi:hypothetical protein
MTEFDIWMHIAPTPLFKEGGKDDTWCKCFLEGITSARLCRLEPVKGRGFVANALHMVTDCGVLAAENKMVRVCGRPQDLLVPTKFFFSLEMPCAFKVFENRGLRQPC